MHTHAAKKKQPFPITEGLEFPRLQSQAMADKRKAEGGAGPSRKAAKGPSSELVNPQRMRVLKQGTEGAGPVIYWYGSLLAV